MGTHRCARAASIESLERRQLMTAVLDSAVNPANGHVYKLLDAATWADAQAAARQLGGDLVTVNDADEQAWVWSTFSPSADLFWIGINDEDRDGVFTWASGQQPAYTNWAAGEPNDSYATGEYDGTMWAEHGGAWNDLGPASYQGKLQKAVVEISPGADLTARVTSTPVKATAGGSINALFTVDNAGANSVTAAFAYAVYLSRDGAVDADDVPLGTGAFRTNVMVHGYAQPAGYDTVLPTGLAPGRYRILVRVDADDEVAETDETNNVAASDWIDVGGTAAPVYRDVTGRIRDNDGSPLNGVRVAVGDRVAYTDYDGGSRRLDGVIDGDFELRKALVGYDVSFGGVFSHFRPADVSEVPLRLNPTADGWAARSIGVGPFMSYDPAARGGALPARVALRTLTFANSSATDGDGKVYLHVDLRNAANSIVPTTRPPAIIAATARYKATVAAVTAKLSALGFREADGSPLAVTESLAPGSAAAAAVRAFREATFGYAVADPRKPNRSRPELTLVDGRFATALNERVASPSFPLWLPAATGRWVGGPAGYATRATWVHLQQLSGALPDVTTWALTAASTATGAWTGPAFHDGPAYGGAAAGFGWVGTDARATSGLADGEVGTAAAHRFWEPVPGVPKHKVRLIGGKAVAIPDPAQLNVTWRYRADYDQAKTKAAIEWLLLNGNVRVAFNDPQILADLGAIKVKGASVKLLRTDLVPTAGYDTQVGARFRNA
ncbi:MAG TPA: lectin-like protein [Humisphaera sp.]